jgi:hypothetical protein
LLLAVNVLGILGPIAKGGGFTHGLGDFRALYLPEILQFITQGPLAFRSYVSGAWAAITGNLGHWSRNVLCQLGIRNWKGIKKPRKNGVRLALCWREKQATNLQASKATVSIMHIVGYTRVAEELPFGQGMYERSHPELGCRL